MEAKPSLATPLTELLQIQHPILLAPMAMVAGGALAAAVSRAGGFGIIGGGYGDQAWLETQLQLAGDASVGVGFITWSLAQQPQLLDLALAHQPRAIFLSFGELEPFATRVKDSGVKLIAQIQSLEQARAALEAGADMIVAQGAEAGGHGAARSTLPLVPEVVDAVQPLPVVAAGGIADGRGLAASLMLGASGVLMGTRFYASAESLALHAAKAHAAETSGDHTTRSAVFDILRQLDWPKPYSLRTLTNDMTRRWETDRDAVMADPAAALEAYRVAVEAEDFKVLPVIAGEATGLVNDIPPAAEIVERTVAEAVARFQHLGHVQIRTAS